jgi:transposase
MATAALTFARWLQDSAVPDPSLTTPQRAVLEAAFRFLDQRGHDYFSRRLLSHVLLHAQTGLKVAQVARLLGFSRSAASAQQGLSSKEVVRAAHQRLAGRAHGKLLPRFAGPIAQFLCEHPQATRWDLLDFIQRSWGVSVSRMALYRFLKKYGLDQAGRIVALPTPATAGPTPAPDEATPRTSVLAVVDLPPSLVDARVEPTPVGVPVAPAVALPPAAFFSPPPSTLAPSCSCPAPSTGSPAPGTASPMTTAPCSGGC